MNLSQTIQTIVVQWTDAVARGLVTVLARFVSPKILRFTENDDGCFSVAPQGRNQPARSIRLVQGTLDGDDLAADIKGSRVEFVLQAKRFLQRPLDLPIGAADFLDGIVRAHIDRLTPWPPQEAMFGCTAPVPIGNDRLRVNVIAAPDRDARPLIDALMAFHPSAISAYTLAQGEHVKVFEQARGIIDMQSVARGVRVVLVLLVAAFMLSSVSSLVVGSYFDGQRDQVNAQIAQRRAAQRAGNTAIDQSPLLALERRKNETASTVIVLEAISRILPDHTYVTEFHVEGDVLRISGVTSDAPSLISLIERSRQFTRATFFAPTTRAASENSERFHIQARIEPFNLVAQK